jgi:hypothetical protein
MFPPDSSPFLKVSRLSLKAWFYVPCSKFTHYAPSCKFWVQTPPKLHPTHFWGPYETTNIVWQEASILISWDWMAGRPPLGVWAHFPAHSCCGRVRINVSAFDWETAWGSIWRMETLLLCQCQQWGMQTKAVGEPGWEPIRTVPGESPSRLQLRTLIPSQFSAARTDPEGLAGDPCRKFTLGWVALSRGLESPNPA